MATGRTHGTSPAAPRTTPRTASTNARVSGFDPIGQDQSLRELGNEYKQKL